MLNVLVLDESIGNFCCLASNLGNKLWTLQFQVMSRYTMLVWHQNSMLFLI